MNNLRVLLFPFAFLFWILVTLRNKFYDWGLFTVHSYSIPIISVGNISAGGSGKSPMVEYLIRLLKEEYKIAIVSRGYGRKTNGFIEASALSTPAEIGDEPTQFKQKFNEVTVAVSEKRCIAINALQEKEDLIILDDAFQHRSVKPGLSILLFDYQKLFSSDFLLPMGNLRDVKSASKRADIIVVTKTNKIFSPMERRRVEAKLDVAAHQQVFCSFIKYADLLQLHKGEFAANERSLSQITKKTHIIILTAIANPKSLLDFIELKTKNITHIKFPDHHNFSSKDIKRIAEIYQAINATDKFIITTEKDAMRLNMPGLMTNLAQLPVYYLPIEAELHEKDKEQFDALITNYVKRTKANN